MAVINEEYRLPNQNVFNDSDDSSDAMDEWNMSMMGEQYLNMTSAELNSNLNIANEQVIFT